LKSITKYRAPSWAWASVEGEVSYLLMDAKIHTVCYVIEIQMTGPTGLLNSPGQVVFGYCRLEGHMVPTLGWERNSRNYSMTFSSVIDTDDNSTIWTGDVDYFPDITPRLPLQNVMCMPLVKYEIDKESSLEFYAGLILEPSDSSIDEYRRISTFRKTRALHGLP